MTGLFFLSRSSFFFLARIVFITLFFFRLTVGSSQKNCVLRKDRDSIKVYTCDAAQSKFKFIKSSFTLNTKLSHLAAFLMDIDNYGDWEYKTINARILQKISDVEMVYYTEIVAPWPVSNRDLVIHLKMNQDPKTKVTTITANSVPDFCPRKEDIVRVPFSTSQWTIVQEAPSKLSIEYSIEIDPGGSVPAWLVNMVAAQAPYESFKNLRDKIQFRNYKKETVPSVSDY